jgi:predicted nucleic acid-binding protein
MNAVDTNILVYSLDDRDAVKRNKARTLLRQLRVGSVQAIMLWQVAGEFLRQLRAWRDQGTMSQARVLRYFALYRRFYALVTPGPQVLDRALDLAERFSLSHWDSMLLAACLEASVDTLYTEDMGAPTRFDTVQLVNPFI